MKWLAFYWDFQANSITYSSINQAINAGIINNGWLTQWQISYSRLVSQRIIPSMTVAATEAAKAIEGQFSGLALDMDTISTADWAAKHCGNLIADVVEDQRKAVSNLVSFAARFSRENEGYTTDELARFIRPCIGLSGRYSKAAENYFQQRVNDGATNEVALRMSQQYADRLKRTRAMTISRTELAYAYNYGTHEGTRQAVDQGYLPPQKKVWSTAEDERVCALCGDLDGTEVGFDDDFDFKVSARAKSSDMTSLVPPAHPGCRCVVMYKPVEE